MKKEPKSARLDIRVPQAVKDRLEVLAKADKRELPDYLRLVIEDHIAAHSKSKAKSA